MKPQIWKKKAWQSDEYLSGSSTTNGESITRITPRTWHWYPCCFSLMTSSRFSIFNFAWLKVKRQRSERADGVLKETVTWKLNWLYLPMHKLVYGWKCFHTYLFEICVNIIYELIQDRKGDIYWYTNFKLILSFKMWQFFQYYAAVIWDKNEIFTYTSSYSWLKMWYLLMHENVITTNNRIFY